MNTVCDTISLSDVHAVHLRSQNSWHPNAPTTIDATCNLHPNSEHSVNIAPHARICKLGHILFCNMIVALVRIMIVGKFRWFARGTTTTMLPDMPITFTEEGVEINQAGLLACICLLRWSSTDPISCQAAPLCQLDQLKSITVIWWSLSRTTVILTPAQVP